MSDESKKTSMKMATWAMMTNMLFRLKAETAMTSTDTFKGG